MKKIILLTLLVLPFMAKAQLLNPDFEQWQNDPTDPTFPNKPLGWIITDGFSNAEHCMYPPDTDAQNGEYALMLGIWYHYVKDAAKQTAPINYRPAALKGYYKYTDNVINGATGPVNDVAQVNIYLTKWNAALGQNDTIGRGKLDLHNSIDYSSFSCPVTYSSDAVPDTVILYLDCTRIKRAGETENLIRMEGFGSYFTVDNISLEETSMGNDDFALTNAIKLYPNPATDAVTVTNFSGDAELYDIAGKLVLTKQSIHNNPIDVQQLQKGIYTVKLTQGNSVQYSKLIKE
jgi:hypothetical protein